MPIDPRKDGLRTVAAFEALKGFVVLGAGFGMLSLLHRDARHVAEALVTRLHIDPSNHYAGLFLDAADKLTDAKLWATAALALAYSVIRFTEGYGLWRERRWAVWLGAASGAIYIPVELYELVHKPGWIKAGAVLLNALIVLYLLWNLRRDPAAAPGGLGGADPAPGTGPAPAGRAASR